MCLCYNARRLYISVTFAVALCATGCIDAPHDNPYDPENPNKAFLSLTVNELGQFDLQGAVVDLVHDETTVQSDTSNEHGIVIFRNIDPGIYQLRTEAMHYAPVEQGPETLWAGFEVSRKIEMITLHFEDEMTGTSSPHRLTSVGGTWEIVEDHGQPEAHSTPNVYQGIDDDPEEISLALCENATQAFLVVAKLKVDAASTENWRAGIVFRYQNALNGYRLLLSSDTIQCYYLVNGQFNDVRSVERELTTDTWYTIRVGRNQSEGLIRISLNNEHLFTVNDIVFLGGQVGLMISNGDDFVPAIVNFDDVTIDLTYSYTQ
ncbi:MAG: carboxypeptidase regulatory-like domain-containing protein [candidate division WOR-3 bacterium]|nr:MAG: carboxypeptidase regulatory-like domain-containing protein [candidate division WOR-3 bacterium]